MESQCAATGQVMRIRPEYRELVFGRARQPVAILSVEQYRAKARRGDRADKTRRQGGQRSLGMAVAAAQREITRNKPGAIELDPFCLRTIGVDRDRNRGVDRSR
jgi:hypothetical protein